MPVPPMVDRPGPDLLPVLQRARDRGFLGPGPLDAHVAHAASFRAVLGPEFDGRAVDLGSGGGVPGLILAVALPRSSWRLVDATRRRVDHLDEAIGLLGLEDRVVAVHGRTEDLGRDEDWRGSADAVVARSFGPPAVVAEAAAPLLRVGGVLAVSEPPRADGERWPADGCARLGLRVVALGVRAGHQMAELELIEACPPGFPRRAGVPERRPLF